LGKTIGGGKTEAIKNCQTASIQVKRKLGEKDKKEAKKKIKGKRGKKEAGGQRKSG